DHKGLRVFDRARAGGRVARVSECTRAFQFFQLNLTKDLRAQAHVLVQNGRRAWTVPRDNAGARLGAMLQGGQPVVGKGGPVRVDTKLIAADVSKLLEGNAALPQDRYRVFHIRGRGGNYNPRLRLVEENLRCTGMLVSCG